MANAYHQWEIRGISVLKEVTKGLIPIQMHFIYKKSAPKFEALSCCSKSGLVEDVSQTKLHSPNVSYTSGGSVRFSD